LTLAVSDRRDHIRGNPSSAMTLVEYGDFECPHCGQAHLVLGKLMDRMGDQVRLVFRHFPLAQIHPHAELAAEAAEAAGAQGQFWEMHDMLFENQDALDAPSLAAYAGELGLDLPRFELELVEHSRSPRVREDFASGVRSGVNGTPTFFINGRRHNAPWDLESLTQAIEEQSGQGTTPRSRKH
jgi:protein-disulfide isomerase